ncbi:MAG: CynX/NimT family MFS transporter [Acidimicrobiales bacterium]
MGQQGAQHIGQDAAEGGRLRALRRRGRDRQALSRLALLWLAGFNLRATLLALPPLLPLVSSRLHLDQTAVGALTNLPVLLLGVAAVAGSFIIGRLGTRRALIAGLLVEATAGALRGVGESTTILFSLTFAMGIGIAVMQPALPTLVREWLPGSVGTATAVYGNGLLVGEALAASVTLPFVLPATGSWPASLAIWSGPAVVAAMFVLAARPAALIAGATPTAALPAAQGPATSPAPRRARIWPDWRSGRTWKLGLVQGGASTAYFATNTFLPGYLHAIGHPGLVSVTLTALNVSQLPASALLLAFSRHLVGRRWPLVSLGLLLVAATAGLLASPAPALLAPVVVIGFCTSMALLLALALPALWCTADEVPRVSAGMFTVGYCMAFVLPLLGGIASDASGSLGVTLVPALAGAAIMAAAATSFGGRASPAPA